MQPRREKDIICTGSVKTASCVCLARRGLRSVRFVECTAAFGAWGKHGGAAGAPHETRCQPRCQRRRRCTPPRPFGCACRCTARLEGRRGRGGGALRQRHRLQVPLDDFTASANGPDALCRVGVWLFNRRFELPLSTAPLLFLRLSRLQTLGRCGHRLVAVRAIMHICIVLHEIHKHLCTRPEFYRGFIGFGN